MKDKEESKNNMKDKDEAKNNMRNTEETKNEEETKNKKETMDSKKNNAMIRMNHGLGIQVETKSNKKRNLILEKAKLVFIRKGFTAVTMKDIIEECGISRGGIYLYFQSVDEIFMQVIIKHNDEKLKETKDCVLENKSFEELIDEYFDKQKGRIKNMHKSLLVAMYEFRFAHKEDYDKDFFQNQFINTKNNVLEILNYGVQKGLLKNNNIDELAMNIVFLIEGLSMLAPAAGIAHDIIDSQIESVKKQIYMNIES